MAESKVHRIVKTHRRQHLTAGSFWYVDYAPPGYRIASHHIWLAEDNDTALVQRLVDYGPNFAPIGDSSLTPTDKLTRVYHRYNLDGGGLEVFFTTVYERSDEPDVILEMTHEEIN